MIGIDAAARRRSAGGGAFTSANLTIAPGATTADLTDYPVYVNLADMPSGFWSAVTSDGGNIRVKQSGSDVPFDVVKIDTGAHTGTLFFKAASLLTASSNVFAIQAASGSGLTMPAVGASNGRNAVWSAFDWVYMGEAITYIDRTGGAAGTKTGSDNVTVSSLGGLDAGCGVATNATAGTTRIDWTGRTSRTVQTLAYSGKLAAASIGRTMTALSHRNAASGTTDNRISMGARDTTPDQFHLWDNLNGHIATPSGMNTDTSPHRFHAAYNSTTERRWYGDGVLKQLDSGISAHASLDTYTLFIEDTSVNDGYNGRIAYAYSRPEALSAAYIAAEYSNLNAPSSFYSIS